MNHNLANNNQKNIHQEKDEDEEELSDYMFWDEKKSRKPKGKKIKKMRQFYDR